jgi:hypothetical protein
MPDRRFPPPWTVEEFDNERRGRSASPPSSWAVSRNRHHMHVNTAIFGQPSLFCYEHPSAEFSRGGVDEPGRRSAAKLLKDEAQRIAANIAKLPQLVRQFRPLPSFPAKLRAEIF